MRFSTPKKRTTPAIIIVSLIDVLMVVLIFMMVSTTFKKLPSVQLALPESKQAQGAGKDPTQPVIITIAKSPPHLYLDSQPVTAEKLESELKVRTAANPQLILSIRADTDAPFGQVVKVRDAAQAAGIKNINAFVKAPGAP